MAQHWCSECGEQVTRASEDSPWLDGAMHSECGHADSHTVDDMADRALRATLDAKFTPASDGTEGAMVSIGGVNVVAWIDEYGTLQVSVNYDTADTETFPEWEDEVPVRVHGVPATFDNIAT